MLTDDKMQRRMDGIGASEIGALLGLDPYKTRFEVWLRIMGKQNRQTSANIDRGNFLEPALVSWASNKIGIEFFPAETLSLAGHPRVLATPDGQSESDPLYVLEVKSPSIRSLPQWCNNKAPDRYVVQCLQQALVHNASGSYLAALCGDELVIRKYDRDPEIEDIIIETIERFWRDHVETQRPPDPDGSDAYSDHLLEQHRTATSETISATNDDNDLLTRLSGIKSEKEKLEREEEKLEQQVKMIMGDAHKLIGAEIVATWANVGVPRKVDWKALALSLGAKESDIEKYTQEQKTTRRFSINKRIVKNV